jgi:hypothetical protein
MTVSNYHFADRVWVRPTVLRLSCCPIGPSDYWTFGPSNYWTFGLLDLRTIGPSDYRTFGPSDRHRDNLQNGDWPAWLRPHFLRLTCCLMSMGLYECGRLSLYWRDGPKVRYCCDDTVFKPSNFTISYICINSPCLQVLVTLSIYDNIRSFPYFLLRVHVCKCW